MQNNQTRMTISIDRDAYKTLKHRAINEGKSLSAIVVEAIEKTIIKDNQQDVSKSGIEQ